MLITIRNFIISIVAAFICNKDARHEFRKKYKIKSRFSKLRDDNKRLFNENQRIETKLNAIQSELSSLKKVLMNHTWLNPLEENPIHYLSVACIAKNEGPYLKEWIEYHKILGVEKFYFYDNESTDDTRDILASYIKDGSVEYRYVVGRIMLIPVYQDAILKARGKSRWLAIIDPDEFIVPIEKETIPEFLKDYEEYPGVGINWMCFDGNDHETKPTAHGGLVTANYTRVVRDHDQFDPDRWTKCIVNPNDVVYCNGPHNYLYKNYQTVTENFEQFSSPYTKFHSTKKIRINHYFRKSREEFEEKAIKGCAVNRERAKRRIFAMDSAFFLPGIETAHDFTIQKYVPALKEALGIKSQ